MSRFRSVASAVATAVATAGIAWALVAVTPPAAHAEPARLSRGPATAAAPLPCPQQQAARGYRGTFGESWAQRRLGFQRVWPLTMGQGVTVAVIDSGVEMDHPMLSGRVSGFADLTRTGRRDCVGHGTAVAALIAGRDMSDRLIPLSGVAPAAKLLIIKHQNVDENGPGNRLSTAIRRAVAAQAKVINISISVRDTPDLRDAVRHALGKDVVIVAAAGRPEDSGDKGPAYPASYPGVISVASLTAEGARADTSSLSSKVDVAAPGKALHTAWPGHGYHLQNEGTSFAAAFVSGVAVLVRARHPELDAGQVVHRIVATADGNAGPFTGNGMIDPVQAVTAVLPEESVRAGASPGEPGAGGAATPGGTGGPVRFAAPERTDGRTVTISTVVTGGALSLAGLAALAGIVVPLGRRRGWRPGWFAFPPQPVAGDDEFTVPERATIGAR